MGKEGRAQHATLIVWGGFVRKSLIKKMGWEIPESVFKYSIVSIVTILPRMTVIFVKTSENWFVLSLSTVPFIPSG